MVAASAACPEVTDFIKIALKMYKLRSETNVEFDVNEEMK